MGVDGHPWHRLTTDLPGALMDTFSSRRRRFAAALLLPFVLLLAGCGRLTADFEITSVDEISVAMDIGIDETYLSMMGGTYASAQDLCDEMLAEEDPGAWGSADVESYEEDGIWGCRISGVIERADFGSDLQLSEDGGEYHLVMDTGSSFGYSEEDLESLEYLGDYEFRISFTFPGEILTSAGGTIDGSTVTYDDPADLLNNGVDITAEAGGGFPWLIVVIVAVVLILLALLVIAAVIFFVLRARRAKNTPTSGFGPSGTPGAPGAPGAPGVPPAPGAPGDPGGPGASASFGAVGAAGSPYGSPAPSPGPAAPAAPQWGAQPSSPAAPVQPSPPAQPGQPSAPQWGPPAHAPQAPQQPAPPQQQPWSHPDQQQGQQPWSQPPAPQQDPNAQYDQAGQDAWNQDPQNPGSQPPGSQNQGW